MWKRALVPILCCLLAASVCFAERKRIRLKNGRVIVGEVVEETKEGVKVKGKLAVVFYRRDQIEAIEAIRDAKGEYAARLSKIDAKDASAHVKLGRWSMENKLYKQAVERFKAALAIRKDDERAVLLLRQAQAKLKAAGDGGDGGKTAAGDTVPATTSKMPFDRKLLIRDDDIYRIRLEEIREDDRITVTFRKDAVKRFIREMQGTGDFKEKGVERLFRRLPPARQAKYMIDKVVRDDPIKDDILVKNDPMFMRVFRGAIWRWISGNCASTNCHGSRKGQKGLKLFNFPGRNVNVDYTNFLILDSYHKKGGLQMIRRDQPEKSLLLHYALPKAQAEYRHPKNTKPAFASRDAAGYRQTVEWIKSLAGPRHPNYRIKHRPRHAMKPMADLPGLPGLPTAPPKPKSSKPGKKKPDAPF